MKLVIVEDDISMIERLRLILDKQSGYEIVGSYTCAEEALSKYKKLDADVMLVDMILPGMTGIEFIREVKEKDPFIEMVAFTGCEDRNTVLEAIRAGASGYLLKIMPPRDIHDSLKTIMEGGSPMSPKIVRALVNEIQLNNNINKPLLSKREREVLKFAADELSYKGIAQKLHISHNTVHTHLKNICKKLSAKTRKEAILIAKRKSLI